jgi:hypothetical protein
MSGELLRAILEVANQGGYEPPQPILPNGSTLIEVGLFCFGSNAKLDHFRDFADDLDIADGLRAPGLQRRLCSTTVAMAVDNLCYAARPAG